MLIDREEFHGLIFQRLVEEHRHIEQLLDQAMRDARDDPKSSRASFAQLARAVRLHARAEEEVVFPALDGSRELGHHVRADHIEHVGLEAMLSTIERLPDGPGWFDAIAALRDRLLAHFTEEEEVVFPRARCVVSDAHQRDLLVVWELELEHLVHT